MISPAGAVRSGHRRDRDCGIRSAGKRVDFGGCGFHEITDELIYTLYSDDDKVRRYFRDKEFEADFLYLEQAAPGKEVLFESRTSDDCIWVVTADSDTEPGETYIFDRQTRQLDVPVPHSREVAARCAWRR